MSITEELKTCLRVKSVNLSTLRQALGEMRGAIKSVDAERMAVNKETEEDYAITLEDFHEMSSERLTELTVEVAAMDAAIKELAGVYGEASDDTSIEKMMQSIAAFVKLLKQDKKKK